MQHILKYPKIIIGACVLITAFFCFQLKNLTLENSIRSFFPQNDVAYKRLIDTEQTFGSMVVIGMSLETTEDSIVTPENVRIIRGVTDAIEALDGVEGVDSLVNITYIYGENGSLISGDLVDEDDFTGSDEDTAQIKQKLVGWSDMYDRVMISDDGKAAQLQITLDKNSTVAERDVTLNKIRAIAKELVPEDAGLKVTLYGDPVFSQETKKFMLSDLTKLIPLVAVVVLISLFFSFKTVDGTLLPLIVVLMSAAWSCGLMAMQGIIFTLVSSVIPVALIACGSAYGIHVLTHYYIALDDFEGELTVEKHKEIIISSISDVWVAVLLAGLTTFVGFISNVTSPLVPLRSFAMFTALGIVFSLVLSITFIPSMLIVKPIKKVGQKSQIMEHLEARVKSRLETAKRHRHGETTTEATSTFYVIYRFFAGTTPRLFVTCIAIIVFSVLGIYKIVVDTAMINYLPPDSDYRVDTDYIDERFAGTNQVFFIVEGQENGDMTKPEILKAIDNMEKHLLRHHSEVGKIVSFTTFLKRMNQVMHVPELGENSGSDYDFASFSDGEAIPTFDDEIPSFDDEIPTFGNDDAIPTFDDEIPTFGDDFASAESSDDYVDPNIAYKEKLLSQMTYADGLKLLEDAYAEAGGAHASVEQIVREIQKKLNYNGMAYYEIPADPEKYQVPSTEKPIWCRNTSFCSATTI